MISLIKVIWLQAAPTAFANIGWKFYLVFIIPGTIGCILMYLYFPNTNGLPLEEVAAIFGDADEVAIYQAGIEIDRNTHAVILRKPGETEKEVDHEESLRSVEENRDKV
jgi:hypothetical protein